MASLTIKGVTKRFGTVCAVDNVSLSVEDGELLVIVGPSGCGKTTLVRLIAGLEKPDRGNIYIGECLVNDVAPKDRDVAMVFQDYALYAHMRVYDNLAFGLRMRKTPRGEIDRRVREAAHVMGIEGLLDRRPRQLSGGERQRVALGRAIVRQPILFLMDEPLSNLDALLRVHMRTELIRLHQELGTTTVYVTHDQIEAMTMGTRIAVMSRGRLRQLGTPGEIYHQPANPFVAGFFGSPPMNFVPGSLVSEDGELVYRSDDLSVELQLTGGAEHLDLVGASGRRDVLMGIRPESICLGTKALQAAGSEPTVQAQIDVIEPLGHETIVYVAVGNHSLAIRTESGQGLASGERIPVFFVQEKMYLFDPETEVPLRLPITGFTRTR